MLKELQSFKNGEYKKALEESFIKVDEMICTPEGNKQLQSYGSEEGGA